MTTYTKHVSDKGKVSYREYVPCQDAEGVHKIEDDQLITLLATTTISLLMSIREQLPSHARMAREVKNVENAVTRLASLEGGALDSETVDVGVEGWNALIKAIQAGLLRNKGTI